MQLSELITRVRKQLGDETSAEHSDSDIVGWINEAQLDIARKTETLQSHSQIDNIEDEECYGVPADFIKLRRVTYNGVLLKPTTLEKLDSFYPNRDKDGPVTGVAAYYYVWANKLYLYPAPEEAGTGLLDIWYTRAPIDLSATAPSASPEIPIHFHRDLVVFAVAKGKEAQEEQGISNSMLDRYEVNLSQARDETLTKTNDSYPSVRELASDW